MTTEAKGAASEDAAGLKHSPDAHDGEGARARPVDGGSPAAPVWRRIMAQAAFETRLTLRHGEQLLLTIVLPIILLIALSTTSILSALGAVSDGWPRIDIAAPGVLALCILSTAFTGQAISTGFDRRYGVLRLLATTPLGRSGLLFGKLFAILAVELVQIVIICALAVILGWRPSAAAIAPAVLAILLGTGAFTALALLVAGTLRAEATLAGANLLWVLFLAGGGLVVPQQGPAAGIVGLLPSAALGDALRAAFLHGAFDGTALAVLAGWLVLAGAATVKWFKWS